MFFFIKKISINVNTKVPIPVLNGFYSELWSPQVECTCPEKGKNLTLNVPANINCPLMTTINIPVRNHSLWDSLKSMFLKTLHDQEKVFWNKHFGLCYFLVYYLNFFPYGK